MILKVNMFAVIDRENSVPSETGRFLLPELIDSNADIFKGVYTPSNSDNLLDIFLIFESDDEKRIDALYFVFSKIIREQNGYTAKYLLEKKKRLDYGRFKLISTLDGGGVEV